MQFWANPTCSCPVCYTQKTLVQGIPLWVVQLVKEVSSEWDVVWVLCETKRIDGT